MPSLLQKCAGLAHLPIANVRKGLLSLTLTKTCMLTSSERMHAVVTIAACANQLTLRIIIQASTTHQDEASKKEGPNMQGFVQELTGKVIHIEDLKLHTSLPAM